jgi:ribonuclease BN (tRNA processing enzyme)
VSDYLSLLGVKGGPAIRPGSNMPTSMLLRLGGRTIVIDAGLGVTRAICDRGVGLTEIDLVFVTHLHSDHYLELGPLIHTAWTAGLSRPVTIFGPAGFTEYWRAFLSSMAFDIAIRIEDEGRPALSDLVVIHPLAEGEVLSQDGLSVTALHNAHPPIEESFALRFDGNGKRIVLSGDTAFFPALIPFARDADLLVHEAMLTEGVDALVARVPNGGERLRQHILRSHTSAEDAGRIAAEAGVGRLALNHFVPDGIPGFGEEKWQAAVRKTWSGPLSIGFDGLTIDL